VTALMMRQAMGSCELTGVLVRWRLQDVTLPEAASGAVKSGDTGSVMAGARLQVAGLASTGPRPLHAAAVRKVRHG
jgi:hypothetical protein